MVETIGNPLTWGVRAIAKSGQSVDEAITHLGSDVRVTPRVQRIGAHKVASALRAGWVDTQKFRSDVFVLMAIYPFVGIALCVVAFNLAFLPALFPMTAGFALLGPAAATVLYVQNKLGESGEEPSILSAVSALRSKSMGPVLFLSMYLLVLFVFWMAAAMWVYRITLGPELPVGATAFLRDVLTTLEGWTMIWLGCGIGAVFATLVLLTSLVSFPMLVDRPVGLPVAVATSLRVAVKNPLPTALWGLTVAGLLFLGSLPFFLGLVIVLPVLGHATWHFYRAAVQFE
ncbi:DUF2189 domain-containing protein [Shimia sp. SDUM112013]|uniref:DUF2189 domain-containing protein n=1 Tax=Shimia sp. SDUM112013 TaxID=3136160 RepID=UPI0032EB9234